MRTWQDWARENPEAVARHGRQSFATYYMTTRGRASHMLNNARQRSKRLGVTCSLTSDWLQDRLIAGYCEVTEIAFDMTAGDGKGSRKNPFAPSVERKDPTGPYSPENCVMTVWIYNRAKGAFRLEDLLTLARALVSAEVENRI